MDIEPILAVLLLVTITRCNGDSFNGYNKGNGASRFGELLKPPPPPPLSPLIPVPFHGGAGRSQRQNVDLGYQYQPPPPPPPPPAPISSDFKFPAPFYKQYNFNFVPPPQPFTTTPSPSLFQKVSGWLFQSQNSDGYDLGPKTSATLKKDCNPCNLVPWIPVIRYDLGAKNAYQSSNPTYGPPSPTGFIDQHNINPFEPQAFRSPQSAQFSPGVPHAVYGLPLQSQSPLGLQSSTYRPPISTYGPPSPTHTVSIPSQTPISSTYSGTSTAYSAPSSTYGIPSTSVGQPVSTFGISSSSQGFSSTYNGPSPLYTTVSPSSSPFSPSSSYGLPTPVHESNIYNSQSPLSNDVKILRTPDTELQLPKVTPPSIFKNSYGETISNSYISDVPYSVSATAAESTKVKTEVLPSTNLPVPNTSLALANPAPFSLNRGRNIHTLQPVALPNLSVSPLPPIFNARPFRPTLPNFSLNVLEGSGSKQKPPGNNIQIQQSIPLAEFTHSVDYPASVVQSQIIDVEVAKRSNQTKAYRNIPNAYVVNEIRDISSQASEDHLSSTKTLQDASFESTGLDVGNELYDSEMPLEFKHNKLPSNHKTKFADLRGVKDEDVDKYRTESNLQNIDSPLLYLKPNAPHKGYGDFVIAVSTATNNNDYEIYDDIPTTEGPNISTQTSAWDESRTDYSDGLPPPTAAQESVQKPKIVQIIVPYTTGKENDLNNYNYAQNLADWVYAQEEYQARKIPSNTGKPAVTTAEDTFNTPSTTTEDSTETVTETFDSERIKTAAILNDLYDVKEPPFDIIKLQHTIDDWTQQEYSEQHKASQKNRGSEKYAKQIPDDYFTTTVPSNYVTNNNFDYDYDHESSSSIQHSVRESKNSTFSKGYKEYNSIERVKPLRTISAKDEENREKHKLHIYTAASSFRSTTATPAPWETILTSISPLTKEKIYVVTSKPWRESRNSTNDWYPIQTFESKKTRVENEAPADNMPFKSPRFLNRPSFGFTSDDNDSMNSDSSFGFSKSWYQSINDLEKRMRANHSARSEDLNHKDDAENPADTTSEDVRRNNE